MDEYSVKVYIYDISKGMARTMSRALVGKQLDGIWHTGIVVYGQEFFFGGMGIESCPPGAVGIGPPDSVVEVGKTQIPCEMFMDYLQELATSTYRPECYHLLDHNCNTFSAEIAQFLTGHSIPSYITNLPQEVMSTPFGAMIRPFIDSMSVQPPGGHRLFSPQQNTAAASPGQSTNPSQPATNQIHSEQPPVANQKAADVQDSRNNTPVTFSDTLVLEDFADLKAVAADSNEEKLLDEIHEYVASEKCSWSLGRPHIVLTGNLLHKTGLQNKHKTALLGLMRFALLKEDMQHLLKCDRDNKIVKYLQTFETLEKDIQTEVVKLCANCCSHTAGLEWCSAQENGVDRQQTVSRICVASLLHTHKQIVSHGAALTYNFTNKKVNEELAVELGSAVLQCITNDIPDQAALHCLIVLHRCMESSREVVDLAGVMGMDVSRFSQRSAQLTSICSDIQKLLIT